MAESILLLSSVGLKPVNEILVSSIITARNGNCTISFAMMPFNAIYFCPIIFQKVTKMRTNVSKLCVVTLKIYIIISISFYII